MGELFLIQGGNKTKMTQMPISKLLEKGGPGSGRYPKGSGKEEIQEGKNAYGQRTLFVAPAESGKYKPNRKEQERGVLSESGKKVYDKEIKSGKSHLNSITSARRSERESQANRGSDEYHSKLYRDSQEYRTAYNGALEEGLSHREAVDYAQDAVPKERIKPGKE